MEFLLRTKLAAPVIRERLVSRSRLFNLLEDGLLREGEFQRKLTLVSAPTGYGKTTLIAGWLRSANLPFAWLSLDETDNDPSRFLAYFVSALIPFDAGNNARRALQSPRPSPSESVVSILLNEIAACTQSFILVLDDYHAIHAPQIHRLLAFFLDHQPTRIHLILITREDPLLPVPRLRACGQLVEIRQEDLKLTIEEACQFLRDVMRLDLSSADVAVLGQRTEGWVAGLQLAGMAIQSLHNKGADFHDFIRDFAGSNRYIIDYLIAEVFQQQTREIQDFLLQTSILRRMNADLCDAVIGKTGSRDILAHLEQVNLFLIPLDPDREWYRYHNLFADFLHHRMRVQYAQQCVALNIAASQWFEAHGEWQEAVEHALTAEDWDHAARLIGAANDGMLRRGEIATLLACYKKLPEALIRSRIDLVLGYAWSLVLSGQFEQAESLLNSAEPQIVEGSIDQGNLLAVRAYLARERGDHAAVISASERALVLLKSTNPSATGVLAVNLGIAYWHSGRLDETVKVMSEVKQVAAQTGNDYALLTAAFFRTRTLASRGLLQQAEQQYQHLIEVGGQTPITALAHYDLGTIYIEWNHLQEAEQHVERGMELSAQTDNKEFLSSGRILRAMISLAKKDSRAARYDAELAYDLSSDYSPGAQARSEALRAQIALADGDLEQAEHCVQQMQPAADVHPFYRFLDLTRPRLLIARGRKTEAKDILSRDCETARQNGWGYGFIAALVLRALASPEMNEAVELLAEALKLAEPDGFLRTFLDAGSGLIPILQFAVRQGVCPDYAGRILAAFKAGETSGPVSEQIEALSERELEVLRLVTVGYSNREIARQLCVTLGTAKTHIHNICGKLGVRNRTEAAVRARELHIA